MNVTSRISKFTKLNGLITRKRLQATLTVFLVEEDFKLVVELVLEHVVYPGDGLLIRQLSVHEGTPAGLLHNFGAIVAGDLAEGFVAVHDGEVDYLCVGQQEAAVS